MHPVLDWLIYQPRDVTPRRKSTLANPSDALREALGVNEDAAAQIVRRDASHWYRSNLYVKRCIDVQADAIAQTSWALYRDPRKKQRVQQHPALEALNAPAALDRADFLRSIMAWLKLWGNAYVYNAGTNQQPELYLLSTPFVEVIPDERGFAAYYELSVPNSLTKIHYALDEVVHLKRFTVASSLYGMSDLEAAFEELQIGALARRTRRNFWQNDARPSGILQTDAEVDEEEGKRQVRNWVKLFRGPDKAGKTAFLSHGIKYQAIGLPMNAAQWLEQHNAEAQDVCAALGVPWTLINPAEQKYATAKEAKQFLWHETILPIGAQIAAGLSRAPWAQGCYLDLDTSDIEALKTDTAATRDDAIKKYVSGLIHFNRGRELIGEPPIPGGDLFLVPSNRVLVPADQLANQGATSEPTQDGDTPAAGQADSGAATPGGDAPGDGPGTDPGDAAAGADAPAAAPLDPDRRDAAELLAQLVCGDAALVPDPIDTEAPAPAGDPDQTSAGDDRLNHEDPHAPTE